MPRFEGSSIVDSEGESMEGSSLMDQLIHAVSDQKADFCCGGTVRITQDSAVGRFDKMTCDDGEVTCPPVVLRWDLPSGKTIRKLTLPPDNGVEDPATIKALLKHCTPATFGKDGEEVLDGSYREAVKLDANQFSTNFHPSDVGILDNVTQVLLPDVAETFAVGETIFEDNLGVVAELYKLNIYSGPSGKFRAHVDTPRGATQFGSLVVCLPYPHQGGQLRVAHQGRETICDWSAQKGEAIKWAAFYSDCEHEVLEVISGHRITLTYNLYVRESFEALMRQHSGMNSKQYTLHNLAIEALRKGEFMREGGVLGFYCQHAYAHTNEILAERLPYALKGVDAIFYSVFYHMDLVVEVKPVLDFDAARYRWDDTSADEDGDLIGTALHRIKLADIGGHDDEGTTEEIVRDSWKSEYHKEITWLNEPGPKEVAMVHMAYGNEPSLQWHYSSAAILVEIPKFGSKSRKEATRK